MTHSSFSEVRLSAAILEDTRTFLLLSENSRVPQDFKAARNLRWVQKVPCVISHVKLFSRLTTCSAFKSFALPEGVFFDGPVLDAQTQLCDIPFETLVCMLVESRRWLAAL